MDKLSTERRSANMRNIRSADTAPERCLRTLVHRMGYRFRLHRRDLPGKPDLVFPSRRKIIFVHGCFWHQHPGCREGRIPSSRVDYWQPKFLRNKERDVRNEQELASLGWDVLVIWECEIDHTIAVSARLEEFLAEGKRQAHGRPVRGRAVHKRSR